MQTRSGRARCASTPSSPPCFRVPYNARRFAFAPTLDMRDKKRPGPHFALNGDDHIIRTENAMPTTSAQATTAASRPAQTQDAIELLKDDHRAIEKLFEAFQKAKDDDLDAKSALVRRACEELTVHAMIEEQLLYPAAQKALHQRDRPDVEEAYVEHYLVKVLIDKFMTLKAGEAGFDATFKVMSEMVRHHIEEEETDFFPKLRESGTDLDALGKKLMQRKEELESKIPKDAGDNTERLH
ncbi:hypothetical protein CBA19CS42_30335 [Caballeronia novacaledonica]|uniref:Hemerythrin-like domain-containing protein n=2 Tax=Caballeronia novacaledonica TaxID=1544861 RepID=A0AA37MIQ8_9BURK|nr:hypothetical protein CBA19CS42_30335 [Caballeronia novacaledonica]